MSVNYTRYNENPRRRRVPGDPNHPLRGQLEELMLVVVRCERMWALEDRIERGFGGSRNR